MPKGALIGRLGTFLSRRPRLVVGIWLLLVAALAFQGRNLDKELHLHSLFLEGTPSKRAHDISVREFGNEYATIVMLRGPQAAVRRQGQALEQRFAGMPGSLVVSPWTPGAAIGGLSPRPGVRAMIVRNEEPKGGDVFDLLPPIQRRVDETVHAPVRASVAGFPSLITSIRDSSNQAAVIGEFVALPVLLLVLLLVFRSVLAAMIPVLVGGAVVAAGRGVISLLLGLVQVDLFAASAVGMMGLALGVDYSLLVVSRFREEQQKAETSEAVERTVRAAARSVIPAGCGLLLAMVAAAQVLPGSAVSAVAIATALVTILSVVSALCVTPALLALLGDNLDRWSLPERSAHGAPLRWSRRISAHPRVVVGILVLMGFCAAWAFTLQTGDATSALLPPGDSGRRQQEEVTDALGPGWSGPIEVLVNGRGSPVTSPSRLRELAAFQSRAERDPGVETVVGFSEIAKGAQRAGGIEQTLVAQERGLVRLDTGISRVHDGAKLNTSGLLGAADGARKLDAGVGAANAGAGVLAKSLRAVGAGSKQLSDGLGQVNEGSGQLADGTSKASTGAGQLAAGLQKAQKQTGEIQGNARLFKNAMRTGEARLSQLHAPLESSEAELAAAWQALQRMTSGRSDPEYATALHALEEAGLHLTGTDFRSGERADSSYKGIGAGMERAQGQFGVGLYLAARLDKSGRKASEGIGKLAQASAQLDRGLQRLATGSHEVSNGVDQLAQGGARLPPSLARLGEGADQLSGGLAQIEAGTGKLAGGLGGGAQKSKLLSGALHRIDQGLKRQRDPKSGGPQLSQLQTQSPGLFRSGYFTLANLDGSRPTRRRQLSFLINLDRGGLDGRILVIPRFDPATQQGRETRDRLAGEAEGLASKTNTEVVLGGVGTARQDVNDTFRSDSLTMRLVLSLITILILVPVVRSLTLPILAAILNLLAASASFGVVSLLFNGSLLGGPGFVDITMVPPILMVMFGLAIDYEVFVFARMREEYVRTGSPSAAIEEGLGHTAHVVTGAAFIMIAVFLSFAISEFASIRNFGVAQAIGVFIDAFIVRLIAVPTVMGWMGRWSWWIPGWLDRILPGGTPVLPRGGSAGASRAAP